MNKIVTITLKELRETFTDRTLLLLMFAAPLALATIIALTFGGLSGGNAPLSDIPIALVNLDEGNEMNRFGCIFVNAFAPQESCSVTVGSDSTSAAAAPDCTIFTGEDGTSTATTTTLQDLTEVVLLTDPAAARAGVDEGTYAAAIIVPADFSQRLGLDQRDFLRVGTLPVESTAVEVYADAERPIAASITRGIVESITNSIASGNITIISVINALGRTVGLIQALPVTQSTAFTNGVTCAFTPGSGVLTVAQQTLGGEAAEFNPLVVIGAAQGIFFALFTANGGAASILEERRNGTLARLAISPTPRMVILLGKMMGTFFTVLLQLVFLFIGFSLVGSILAGELTLIWGTDVLSIVIVLIATAAAATGLGTVIAAAAKRSEQANTIGSVIALFMATLGGSFGFDLSSASPVFAWLENLSIIYWGTDAFTKLASGEGGILVNAVVMLVFGLVAFAIGFYIFNRRLDE